MAKKLQLRRGTTTQHNSFTAAECEVTVDTTKDSLVVHDGSTQGGHPIAKSSDIPSITGKADLAGANFTGNVLIDNAQELRLGEADSSGTNYTAIKAQAQSGDITLTLPAVAPTANQVLKADGSTPTTLTWASDVALTSIDEDNMASDSDSAVPTQQSVKAYVDTQVATKQASDAELTELATMASGTAGALADLLQAEVEILDGALVSTTELNLLDGKTAIGDASKASKNQWTGSQHTDFNTLSISSGAVAIDFDLGNNFYLDLGGAAVTSVTASNPNVGQSGSIIIKGHGSNTIGGWNAVYKFSGGAANAPTITADAAKYDRIDYFIYDANNIHLVWSGNY